MKSSEEFVAEKLKEFSDWEKTIDNQTAEFFSRRAKLLDQFEDLSSRCRQQIGQLKASADSFFLLAGEIDEVPSDVALEKIKNWDEAKKNQEYLRLEIAVTFSLLEKTLDAIFQLTHKREKIEALLQGAYADKPKEIAGLIPGVAEHADNAVAVVRQALQDWRTLHVRRALNIISRRLGGVSE